MADVVSVQILSGLEELTHDAPDEILAEQCLLRRIVSRQVDFTIGQTGDLSLLFILHKLGQAVLSRKLEN